ncbi:hypothetical protein MKW98_013529 [Papaver atlanticum]|uniref:RING-type domain-containing protein n=1 Tax=Papaver atlanticum TaxID=357466 RepID=A0AAD4STM3_9MAGN|nr:hypothetical protein MKW98_013529 [Papaver atlanticum]
MNDKGCSSSTSKDFDPCPICLGSFLQEAYLDRCFHKFCYKCILNWSIYISRQSSKSQSTLTCPLCKGINYSIIYGYDGTSFQQHYINQDPPKQSIFFSKAHRFRLQSYYREPGTIYDKVNIPKYWKYRRYLQLNKWLQSWLKREIQALTQEEDVDIIVHHILGVVESFVRSSQRECSSDITPEQNRQEFKALISEAAKPFLTGRTEHFVNEVELFLCSGLNMEAYDEVYLESLSSVTSSVSEVGEERNHEKTENVPYLHFFDVDSDTE